MTEKAATPYKVTNNQLNVANSTWETNATADNDWTVTFKPAVARYTLDVTGARSNKDIIAIRPSDANGDRDDTVDVSGKKMGVFAGEKFYVASSNDIVLESKNPEVIFEVETITLNGVKYRIYSFEMPAKDLTLAKGDIATAFKMTVTKDGAPVADGDSLTATWNKKTESNGVVSPSKTALAKDVVLNVELVGFTDCTVTLKGETGWETEEALAALVTIEESEVEDGMKTITIKAIDPDPTTKDGTSSGKAKAKNWELTLTCTSGGTTLKQSYKINTDAASTPPSP